MQKQNSCHRLRSARVEARTVTRTVNALWIRYLTLFVPSFRMNWSSGAKAVMPSWARERTPVVRRGCVNCANGMSLNPTMETSSGIFKPALRAARIALGIGRGDLGLLPYWRQPVPPKVVRQLDLASIISKLDRTGKSSRILVIESNLRIPYTPVFFF